MDIVIVEGWRILSWICGGLSLGGFLGFWVGVKYQEKRQYKEWLDD